VGHPGAPPTPATTAAPVATTAATTTTATEPPTSTSPATTTSVPEAPCGNAALTQPPGTVWAFYAQCEAGFGLYPVYRPGEHAPTLQESLAALVAGTSAAERDFGLRTGFDYVEEADQIEVAVTVDSSGIAHIGFSVGGEPWSPGSRASTSHQLASFLDPLEATVFQHGAVAGIDPATVAWGESGLSETVRRQDWEGMLFRNTGILSEGGCTPELALWYPADCTLPGRVAQGTVRVPVVNVAADDVLHVRAGPGAGYFAVAELDPIATVAATAETTVAADGGTWRLTDLGWVNDAYIAEPDPCDPEPIATIASEALDAARLVDADAEWVASEDGGRFGERTTDPGALARNQGLDCSWQAIQHVGAEERLLVAAWTGSRVSMVIQATDGPTRGYVGAGGPDMAITPVAGELVAAETWAMTLPEGETLILLTRGKNIGLGFLAKSWTAGDAIVPGADDPVDPTATEAVALPALRAAGGRTVAVAEPSDGGSVASISLVSPRGDGLFAAVGPADRFDPVELVPGGVRFDADVAGTSIRLVDPAADYPASAADFSCNGYAWFIEADDGSVVETLGFVETLLGVLGCR
jgi:hypothetical protein